MATFNLSPTRCYPSSVLALELTPGRGLFSGEIMNNEKRFWSKVDKSGGPDACWPWTASLSQGTGYGAASFNGKRAGAHRIAYELSKGPIPEGLTIDHLCRKRDCINPAHLEAVTLRVNILRSPTSAGAVNARKTHCKHGHPLSGSNLATWNTRRERVCKTCEKIRGQRYERKSGRKSLRGQGRKFVKEVTDE